jgi:hypothetical protein
MSANRLLRLTILSLTVSLAACASRTTAATQPSPAAFTAGDSDPKAVALVDEMLAAVGGADQWAKTKQVRWTQKYMLEGKMSGLFKHAWDRWNGRHRFDQADMPTYVTAVAEGDESKTKYSVAMYDLLDHEGKGYASYGGQQVGTEDRDKMVASAFKNFNADTYRIVAHYKLKDPGVRLHLDGEIEAADGRCDPKCSVVKVTFDPAVGEDTYFLSISQSTKLPEVLEKSSNGGRVGFSLQEWTTVGGMKFPTKLQNMGMPGEIFQIESIEVGEPDDELYIPQVR